jgi:hypothetical protein
MNYCLNAWDVGFPEQILPTHIETSIIRITKSIKFEWYYIYCVHYKITPFKSFVVFLIQGGMIGRIGCC